jgi:2-C-methyl-D-erythritol 4-phosphate cytidylyltransferase
MSETIDRSSMDVRAARKYAVIVAGGSGLRMGTQVPKQFLLLCGKPVLSHTLTAFQDAYEDMEIILVLPEEHMETGKKILYSTYAPHRIRMVAGGPTRYHSVANGLQCIREKAIIFVHDGVRCLVTTDLIRRCYEQAVEWGNAIPAIACTDSIRIETGNGSQVLDRSKIRIIQTPQTFDSDLLQAAFEQGYQESFTDEAGVVERSGTPIHLIEGEPTNIKITRPIDLALAEKILEERAGGSAGEQF